jgi:hypothetical protein
MDRPAATGDTVDDVGGLQPNGRRGAARGVGVGVWVIAYRIIMLRIGQLPEVPSVFANTVCSSISGKSLALAESPENWDL